MSKPTDPRVERFNASYPFDCRLAEEDIRGSMAWASALRRAGILNEEEETNLRSGLAAIRDEFAGGTFPSDSSDEDIHSAVERRLTELIGPVAGKLHTGRSRNDQVVTDFRLWVMGACASLSAEVLALQQALVGCAAANLHAPMPGYTHLRQAQPITWGHWVLCHFWPLDRDLQRLVECAGTASVLPLGSGALAGTSVPVDRADLAGELGFSGVSPNSLDAVADRDFVAVFLFDCALLGVHLSRLAEQLILFSTHEFGFVELDESFTTGSSLMPQKRNPDPLELTRGKTGRLIGHLAGLLSTLKGLPSAYDKDLQEDKEPAFDAMDTLMAALPVVTGVIRSMRVDPERLAAAITPEVYAVDLADHLVAKGLPFRQAHAAVGMAVRLAEARGVSLDELSPEEWASASPLFAGDMNALFDVQVVLDRRDSVGGTGHRALEVQLEAARARIKEHGKGRAG
ncbi:MAG: argininosuccinate lyase [Anaerolineales bacterium]|nr:argininosuccinate lyase [Anaerolineales bacterium]